MIRLTALILGILLCILPALSCGELAGTVSDDYEPMYNLHGFSG